MSNSQCGRMQALFCPLQTFSVGKRRLCFPLPINGARRLGRMLFRALLFGQDPGMNLSAVRSGQSCTGHGSLGVTPHRLQLKAQRSPHLAEVSTQCCCRRKITTLWITNALPTALPFADLLSDTVLLVRSVGIRAHTGVMELLSFVSLRERCFNLRGSSYGTQLFSTLHRSLSLQSFLQVLPESTWSPDPSFAARKEDSWESMNCSLRVFLCSEKSQAELTLTKLEKQADQFSL